MLHYHYHSLCRPLGRWIGISGEYEIDGRELYTAEALDEATIDRLELEPANDLARLRRAVREAGAVVGGAE